MTARRPIGLAGTPLLEDLPSLDGRRVLVRVDFNVPLQRDEQGGTVVADDFRIRAALPTLEWLKAQHADVAVCSHLGRPKGVPDSRWQMTPVRARLQKLCPGVNVLENLRFSPGETSDDPAFVAALTRGFDVYVNEAFGVAHRRHASVVGPPRTLPSGAGRRFAREVEVLGGLLSEPERPFVAVVGGVKVADKLGVLRQMASRVDTLAVGGAMAFTFLAAAGYDVGASIVDVDNIEACRRLLGSGKPILLPSDIVALEPGGSYGPAAGPGPRGSSKVLGPELPDGWIGLDIGPETAEGFAEVIGGAATVLWNGPLGVVEDERFACGTRRVARAVAECPGYTVVGGGDSARVLNALGLSQGVDFLSTGGGASLAYVEHGDLPALEALRGAPNAPPT